MLKVGREKGTRMRCCSCTKSMYDIRYTFILVSMYIIVSSFTYHIHVDSHMPGCSAEQRGSQTSRYEAARNHLVGKIYN